MNLDEEKKVFENEENLRILAGFLPCFLFKTLTWLLLTVQRTEEVVAGGKSFCEVEFVPSDLRKQIWNVFEKCAG